MLCVLVVQCVLDWMFEIHVVDELCNIWIEEWTCGVDLSPCMEEICASMIDGIALWKDDD